MTDDEREDYLVNEQQNTLPPSAPEASMAYADFPTSDGHWWWEHSGAPIPAKTLRAYGNKLLIWADRAWLSKDEIRAGWWYGPMTKPKPPNKGTP